jgi:hypothetical protein
LVEGLYTGDHDVTNAMHDLSQLQLSMAKEDSLAWQTNLCDATASTSFNLEHSTLIVNGCWVAFVEKSAKTQTISTG